MKFRSEPTSRLVEFPYREAIAKPEESAKRRDIVPVGEIPPLNEVLTGIDGASQTACEIIARHLILIVAQQEVLRERYQQRHPAVDSQEVVVSQDRAVPVDIEIKQSEEWCKFDDGSDHPDSEDHPERALQTRCPCLPCFPARLPSLELFNQVFCACQLASLKFIKARQIQGAAMLDPAEPAT